MKHQVTAIIYDKRGRVLSVGQNSYVKTHPLQAHHASRVGLAEKQFLHAEVAAIVRCRDLKRAHKIVITRFNKRGDPVLAKPCAVCESAILASGIPNISHT